MVELKAEQIYFIFLKILRVMYALVTTESQYKKFAIQVFIFN